MPSPERSLALTRRQDTGVVIAGLSLALVGGALAVALARRSRRADLLAHPERRHAEEASQAARLEAREPVAGASRRACGPLRHDAVESDRSVVHARASRNLDRAAAMLGASVLMDSAVEHYRGMFQNRTMYAPLAVSALTAAASLPGAVGAKTTWLRGGIDGLAVAAGFVGLGFHVRNVLRAEGGLSWQNLFYGAPVGAPLALSIAGALGLAAGRVAGTAADASPSVLGLPAGQALAAFSAFGIAGSAAEAGLLHFRGAFQNPAMLIPVTVPPLAAAMLALSAARPRAAGLRGAARWALRATALAGIGGVGFHAYGVSRMMGGWYNWSQNLVDGPPLPAPPAFTGLALAGLAALDLVEAEHG